MIYAGLIHLNQTPERNDQLKSALESFTKAAPTVIRKNFLTLYYGKLSKRQDMDEVWENDSSILMGRIFDKTKHCSFKKKDFKSLSHLAKEEVLERVWGKYVYFKVDNTNLQLDVILDSTGQLPFFYYIFPNGHVLFSSDIEIIFKVLGQKPEYNWAYLCSYLVYGNSSAIQTPFKNIFELPPACCLKITKSERKTIPFWNPLRSYKTSTLQEKDAVEVLQVTLKPWIEPYQNIIVSLSGGLDSSSLVYCLKDLVKKNQTLKAINYFHSQIQTSNEFSYAQRVCGEAGIDLIGIDISGALPFDIPQKKQPLRPNKPFPGSSSLRWTETIMDHLPIDESSVFISGHGSDHIFMRPPSKKSMADYILERGLKEFKNQLKNVARFYRDSLFSILRENAADLGSHFLSRRLDKRNPKNAHGEIPHWIKQEVNQTISSEFVHPIYEHLPLSVLPGKYVQIDALYEGLASIHMEMDPVNPTSYPFLYEPVVEFALSFSTYELFEKGYDRYPLRKAVSDCFKTETVWRRDKSQTTGIFQLGIKQNLEYVLDICLNGYFAKQGFVDREGLKKTITLIGNGDVKDMWPFMHLASVEIFLRYWDEMSL
jgi:asparagine synthase (glutamine-hydrolysing)